MTDPQAAQLGDRLGRLNDEHPWMEPQVAYSLAASPHSDNTILSMAESFRSSLASARTGFGDLHSDPVLQKAPTVHLAVKRYLNGTLGSWPIVDQHLTDVQRNLQRMGYGQDLPADGAWSQRWNSIWNEASQKEVGRQLAGDKTGSVSTAHAAHSFLSGALPKHAFNAVVGFVKSLPGDVRDVIADSVGVGAFIGQGLGDAAQHPFAHGAQGRQLIEGQREAGRSAALGVQHLLGNDDLTAEQVRQSTTGKAIAGKLVADIGTVFLAHGALKAGTAVARAAGEALTRNGELTLGEALSGPGVVSNLLRPGAREVRAPGVITRTVFGARTAEEIGRDAARSGLVNSRAVQHIPILGRLGPVTGKLADADGVYYKTRTLLASPYRVPALKVGGIAATQGVGLGIQTRSVAAVSSSLTGNDNKTALSEGVQDEHVIDHVDDAIRNATSGITGHRFSLGVDSLMWVLPGVNAGTHAAEQGERALNRINGALGDVGAIGALTRATGKSETELVEMAGSRANLDIWLRDKVLQAGADFHAQRTLTLREDLPTGADRTVELQNLGHEALHPGNEDVLMEGVRGTLANNGHDFEMRVRSQIANSSTHQDKWLRQDLSQWLHARNIVADRILGVPEHAKLLITPVSTHTLSEAKANAKFAEATNISGKAAPEPPSMTAAWLQGNNPDLIAGSVGTARLTTYTKQAALKEIDGFKAQLAQVREIPGAYEQSAAEVALVREMAAFGHDNFRLNSHQLQGLFGKSGHQDAETLAAVLEDHANQLATDVHLPGDAPAALRKAVEDLNSAGYKLVFGTDIGHIYRNDLPRIDVMTGAVTARRRLVSKLGLNPERFTDLQVGSAAQIDVLTEVQRAMDREPPGTFPPGYDGRSMLRDLRNHDLIVPGPHEVGGLKGAAWGAMAPARKRTVEFTAAQQARSVEEVEKELRAEVLGYMNIRDLPEKKIVEILTRTHDVPWTTEVAMRGADLTEEMAVPLMSEAAARKIAKAVRVGYAKRPGYMIGAAKLEDIARAGLGPLGKTPVLGDSTLMRRLDSAPNRYVQLRNWYRFQLSPMFSARRLVKTNFKASLEGIPWTASPLKDLQAKGDAEEAFTVLDRIYPENKLRNEWMDEADRQLRSQDILGLFNNRHFEARAALEWSRQGKSDEQIRGLIQKTFHYGGTTAEGRTAAERSANVVFFPYSFSKTLYRNVGGYLMDRPAQALIIAAGLEEYRNWSENHQHSPLSQKWLEEHLPVLHEMERLNAFSHGISPGELGGINAPIAKAMLNFFMPQKWEVNKDVSKNIKRSVPVYGDFQRVQKALTEQGKITATAIGNSLGKGHDLITGAHRGALDPRAPALTSQAQRDHAHALLFDLEDSYQTVLDYNAAHGDPEDKYLFADDPSLPASVRGKPINRAALKLIAQRFYPAYDPSKDAGYAAVRQARINTFLEDNPNGDYAQFATLAKQVESYKNQDSYEPEQLAAITDTMRRAAIQFASSDAKFREFYKRNYTGTFGPIEKLRGIYRKAS